MPQFVTFEDSIQVAKSGLELEQDEPVGEAVMVLELAKEGTLEAAPTPNACSVGDGEEDWDWHKP